MPKKLTTQEFLEKAKTKANPLLDLSSVVYKTSHTPVKVYCIKHDLEFDITPNAILNGKNSCVDCTGKKMNTEHFIRRAQSVYNNLFDYSETRYTKMGKKVLIRCIEHNNTFEQVAQAHLNGFNGCGQCNGQEKISYDTYIKRAHDVYGENAFDYSQLPHVFGSIHDKVSIRCIEHNVWFTQSAWSHVNGVKSCFRCNPSSQMTKEKFLHKLQGVYSDDKYDYSRVDFSVKGITNPDKNTVEIKCIEHDCFFYQNINNHLSGKEGCPKCHKKNILTSTEDFIEKSKILFPDSFSYDCTVLSEGLKGDVKLLCNKHDYTFSTKVRTHLLGYNTCPECKCYGTSSYEKEIVEILKNEGIENIETNNRTILNNRKELDIYIPDKNIAIEFNGLYWHTELFGKDKHYHRNKWKECKDKGIQLLTIWEDDWKRNPELVKNMIFNKLGIQKEKRRYARQTYFSAIPGSDAKEFLEEHHLQGSHKSSKHFGLIDNNGNIVAIMSVKKQKEGKLEISRFSSLNVQGGFSKLLTNILKLDEYKDTEQVLSYSHNDHSDGNLYESQGFSLIHDGSPGYFYVVNNKREHRLQYSPKRFRERDDLLYEEGLTERELAALNSLERIWDCGSSLHSLDIAS